MRHFLLIMILSFICTSARAELFIFSSDFGQENQVKTNKLRDWYSYISKRLPMRSAGNCETVPDTATQVLPNNEWLIRLDDGVGDECISWSSIDDQWYEILKSIDEQNEHISIWINHNEKVIGWSKDSKVVPFIAKREPQVWRIKSKLTLYQNIKRWADSIGWQLVWNSPTDYPVTATSVHFGSAFKKGGVMDQVLRNLNLNSAEKLNAIYDISNKTLVVSVSKKEQI